MINKKGNYYWAVNVRRRASVRIYKIKYSPFTQIGGAPVAFATRNDIAISSQFLHNYSNSKSW